ncbi:MAG: DJ-1/PfpI family protein [Spirochaetes bacterium]|nr:DJ-1/PfpI family protein [Spirochaetota bacterium]
MKVLVPLAEGFEEIEALTIIDVLRRADIETVSLYLKTEYVNGSHGITVKADMAAAAADGNQYDAIVLPGGMPGSKNLLESSVVTGLLNQINKKNGFIAAICAAPMVLGHAGLLKGKKAVCFPGYESHLAGAEILKKPVVADGNIITGIGAGAALDFSLKLVEIFKNRETALKLRSAMQIFWQEGN